MSSFIQNMMGWSPRCYIPSFVEIGPPVLEKIFTKDVNGYSNIRIRSEYSNTISELNIRIFFLSLRLVIFFTFFVCFFFQSFQTQNYRLVLKGG